MSLRQRSYEKELLDDPDVPFKDIVVNMQELNKVNAQIAKAAPAAQMTTLERRRDIYQIKVNERKILNKTLYTLRCLRAMAGV